MHWLPLVAMVIASALPFPHNPVSRIVAATTEPGNYIKNTTAAAAAAADPLPHDSAPRSTAPSGLASQDYNSHNLLPTDYNMADKEKDLQIQQNFVGLSSNEVDSRGVYDLSSDILEGPPTEGGPVWTQDLLEDTSRRKNNKIPYIKLDFNTNNNIQDSSLSSFVETISAVSQNSGPVVTTPSEQGQRTTETREGPVEETLDALFEGGDMFLDAHPRVLFSSSPSPPEHPPLQLMLESGLLDEEDQGDEEWDAHLEGHGDRSAERTAHRKRDKRSHSFDGRWVQRSVCESENVWVTDKTSAVDSRGNSVSILQEIQTQTGPIKQYFYETRCRAAERPQGKHEETGVAGASCLGIDKKQWKSKCIAKQSFVRALTKDANNRIGWRWIRIDSSCVCVLLSRTNKALAKEVLTGRG